MLVVVGLVPGAIPARAASQAELRQMIGQMIMIGFPGRDPKESRVAKVVRQIKDGKIAGVMLLGYNITSRKQIRALTSALREAGGKLPVLISLDQEGGKVQRLSPKNGYSKFPPAAAVAAIGDLAETRRIYSKMAGELADAGITLNLAPVLDVNVNRANPAIGVLGRSYGTAPDQVTAQARVFIETHHASGILTAAKHFPGHGSSAGDSHNDIVDVSKAWSESESVPFRDLAGDGGTDAMLVGHIYLNGFGDKAKTPATLSRGLISDVLRGRIGFAGPIITDDMEMKAIVRHYSLEEGVLKAIDAGVDILLFSNTHYNDPDLPDRIAKIVLKAVADGRIAPERLRDSHGRVMAMKASLAKLLAARSN